MGWTAVTMAILFATILVHELAHCWAAVRTGAGAEEILLWPLGGPSYVGRTGSPRDDIKIAGIGPLSNFVLCGACMIWLAATGVPLSWDLLNPFGSWWPFDLSLGQTFLLHAARLNLILGLFNLCVPAYPLDGGRILLGFLTMRYGLTRASGATALIAMPIGIALSVWGLAQGEFMLAIIGLWVLFEAYELRQYVRMGEVERHPIAGGAAEFGYEPPRPRRPGFIARWRQRRARVRAIRKAAEEAELHDKVDAILDKVTREGMSSLTFREKRILIRASRHNRHAAEAEEARPVRRPTRGDRARRA
jgi:Zn-dependent protease